MTDQPGPEPKEAAAHLPRPPRGYSWEPFQPGHTLSLHHGAYSPRKVDPLAAELAGQVVALAEQEGSSTTYLTEPSYRASVWAWARAEAKVQLLTEWLMDRTDLDDEGEVRPAAELLEKVERRAESLRARLGLEPLSRARLGRDVAAGSVDVARLMAALAKAQEVDDEATGTETPHSRPEALPGPESYLSEDGNGDGDYLDEGER